MIPDATGSRPGSTSTNQYEVISNVPPPSSDYGYHEIEPADARAAIASYQDYLRLAPPNEEFRPQAENLIRVLREALAHPKQQ